VNPTVTNTEEDKSRVAAALSGDRQAFASIIRQTERLVAQVVYKMIADAEDRKDVAQEIYLKAWRKLPGFRFESKLSTWIAQISYTTCIDHLRKSKAALIEKFEPDRDEDDDWIPGPADTIYQGNADDLAGWHTSAILKNEILKLSPVYRTIITLYHQEELSYDEIAMVTGMPVGTVKSYLFRARKTLKDNLLRQYKKVDL
jgi:RNA polymerase sigma-70 factor (ECF subfamily)